MKLPKVYANVIDKNFDNNNEYFRSGGKSGVDLYELRSLFDRRGFVDRAEVEIKEESGWRKEKIVLMKSNYFVTVDNKKIYFDQILDYKIKK